MSTLYEFLIRCDDNGEFKGAHQIRKDGNALLPATAIKPEDWPAIAQDVNAASLAKIAELEAQVAELKAANDKLDTDSKAAIAELNAKLSATQSQLQTSEQAKAQTQATLDATNAAKAKLETDKSELQSQLSTVTAQRDELQSTVTAGEQLQAQLVSQAKAAFEAGDFNSIKTILETASDTPAVIREKQRKQAAVEAARAALAAAEAEI